MGVLGFAAAVPLALVFATLSRRLREAGIDRATIGFLSWILLAYAFKFAWAPLVDRARIPYLAQRLGQRRSWLVLAQAVVICGLAGMAFFDAQTGATALAVCALATAIASATQDIALDAYRVESVAPEPERQAPLAAAYQAGYRIGLLWAGAGALWIAELAAGSATGYDARSWSIAYGVMAASMLAGTAAVLLCPDTGPAGRARGSAPSGLVDEIVRSVLDPLADFFRRYRWHAITLLALVSTYRFANIVMGVMANTFYFDVGFTKAEVATISKFYGFAMTLAGLAAGGFLIPRLGLARMLYAAAIVSPASILLYSLIAERGASLLLLGLAISVDNFAEGVGGTVFITYLSGLTRQGFTATQYAALSSAAVLLPKLVAGFSGLIVERIGYAAFFNACAASGLVALVLVAIVLRTVPDQRFSKR